jgi:hypothetical protein
MKTVRSKMNLFCSRNSIDHIHLRFYEDFALDY